MSDFYEIDFLKIDSPKSGDAITLRYSLGGKISIHVVDGGYQDTGESIIKHINQYYDSPSFIDRVIVTHPDGDHTGGLRSVLENYVVGELWMLRPWIYANELIDQFSRFSSVENLKKRLREIYPNIAALEEIAEENNIPIYEPFQGSKIGEFRVLSPSKSNYLELIVESEKTPESVGKQELSTEELLKSLVKTAVKKVVNFIKAAWGVENFSDEPTSAENEMSVVQYAHLCNLNILLTGDAGRTALTEAATYAPFAGLSLPGINRFQVPHHGSRRNLSTELLDLWLGKQLPSKLEKEKFSAIISVSKDDKDHPRKAVIRGLIHRGAGVTTTWECPICTQYNAPDRGWGTATPLEYPEDQEE